MRCVPLVGVVLLLGGCSLVGDIRRSPPPPEPTVAEQVVPAPPVRRRPANAQTWTAQVPVPAAYDRRTVEFADVKHGAALFTRCGVDDPAAASRDSCTARLLVTADGGLSWQERKHPQAVAKNQQLYVGQDRSLVLLSGPTAWYVSTLQGTSFRRWPYSPVEVPTAYRALGGRAQVCCDGDDVPTVVRYANGAVTAVPTAPPLPGLLSAAAAKDANLWAASVDAGRPSAAVSTDGGRTWIETPLPGRATGLQSLQFHVSTSFPAGLGAPVAHDDLWLVGAGEDRTRFPTVWRCGPACWSQVPDVGQPSDAISSAPAGGGLLAVSTSIGTGLLGERWTLTDWPVGWISQLADGALQVTEESGTVWLGVGAGADRAWRELVLHQPK